MANQCDGCKAGVETYSRDGITWHVMGMQGKYRDLMMCEASRYVDLTEADYDGHLGLIVDERG